MKTALQLVEIQLSNKLPYCKGCFLPRVCPKQASVLHLSLRLHPPISFIAVTIQVWFLLFEYLKLRYSSDVIKLYESSKKFWCQKRHCIQVCASYPGVIPRFMWYVQSWKCLHRPLYLVALHSRNSVHPLVHQPGLVPQRGDDSSHFLLVEVVRWVTWSRRID